VSIGGVIINILSNNDAAYIAGIIDGEGSIGVMSQHHNTENKTSTYRLRLRVTNTHLGVIEWLRLKIGCGNINLIKKPLKHYRQAYELAWSGLTAINIIRQLYPYMIIKRNQAEVAFEFERTLDEPTWSLPDSIVECRKKLRKKMIDLNNS